jgi:hypothetical protein
MAPMRAIAPASDRVRSWHSLRVRLQHGGANGRTTTERVLHHSTQRGPGLLTRLAGLPAAEPGRAT